MKKHLIILAGFLLLLTPNVLRAQDPGAKLLQSIAKSITTHKDMEVAFTLWIKDEPGDPMEKKDGTAFVKGDAYKILFEDLQILSDGKTEWQYYVEEQEVMVGKPSDDDNPVLLFTALLTQSKGGLLGTDDDLNSVIGLYDNNGEYQDINLIVNKKGDPKKVEFIGDNDEVMMRLEIHNLKFDQALKDDFFSFDAKAHPGVEVIDMR